jgi:hypothetical protein
MVRAVEVLAVAASIAGTALQNSNPQTISTATATITTLFSATIPPHLER